MVGLAGAKASPEPHEAHPPSTLASREAREAAQQRLLCAAPPLVAGNSERRLAAMNWQGEAQRKQLVGAIRRRVKLMRPIARRIFELMYLQKEPIKAFTAVARVLKAEGYGRFHGAKAVRRIHDATLASLGERLARPVDPVCPSCRHAASDHRPQIDGGTCGAPVDFGRCECYYRFTEENE